MADQREERLSYAVRRAALRHKFMANLLRQYGETEGMGEDELIAFLQCSREGYHRLALCAVPDTSAPDFRMRVEQMVESTGISVARLAQVIRHVTTLRSWGEAVIGANLMDRPLTGGELLAARDREEPTEPAEGLGRLAPEKENSDNTLP